MPENAAFLADTSHVDFIIRNLLNNAIKFTPANGYIEIGWRKEGDGQMATVYVKDTGIGISKEYQRHIFEFGYNNNEVVEGRGTGIGLVLCKEFVIENGGQIWLESKLGEGTTFYFSLRKSDLVAMPEFENS